jgi:hypothetical protein
VPDAGGQGTPIDGSGAEALTAPSVLGGRYRLVDDEPIAELDSPGATACVVRDNNSPSANLFARVLAAGIIPRKDTMIPLRGGRDVQIMRPVEWGVVALRPLKRNAFAIVFERPAGGPLVSPGAAAFTPMPVSDLTTRVLGPAALALAHIGRRGITHRAVRPDNLFMGGEDTSHVLIGECVSCPPGFGQPAAFETIEMAMTPPLGRGPGTPADDMYALGVTVLALALGRIPLAGLSAEEIVEAKLARGSFIALLAGERVPFGLREVLRGLLADHPKERWGLPQIEQWLGGGINKSIHDNVQSRMDRPITFRGKDYWGFRDLADAFGKSWQAASTTILEEGFSKWTARGLGDADLAEDVARTLKSARIEAASNPGPDPKLVAQICTILDPDGPIRYRGIIAMPNGLGPMFAAAVRDGARDDVSHICDMLVKGLVIDWLTWREENEKSDLSLALKPYKQFQQLLRHAGPGYGAERCLYELNPHLPCQAPAVEPYYVEKLEELLPTLEMVVRRTGGLPTIYDRHFAAFIANRAKRNMDREFAAMEEARGDPVLVKLGMVRLLAWLQTEYGPVSLPNLTEWLAADLESAADRFASKTMRGEVRRRLAAVAPQGELAAVYNAVCDKSLLARDDTGRRAAVQEYVAARRRIGELESSDATLGARELGARVAAWLGGAAALVSAALVILG